MKNRRIWLLDSSIVGLYGNNVKRSSRAYRNILKICWDNYLRQVIEEANPEFIIGVGKRVEKVLYSRLVKLGIPFETLYQPQAHLSKEERLRNYQRFNEICASIVKGEKVLDGTPISQTKPKPNHTKTSFNLDNAIERKLTNLGYRKTSRSSWQKKECIVHVVISKEYLPLIRIKWIEEWKDDHAIIYDYTKANGPTCIVPIPDFFKTDFVRKKQQQPSYANSGYKWSQPFSLDKPLAQFVLGYKDHWDLL